ncbi:hypothetical protein EV121DRAFT_298088 [Schizophyllum commune]
MSSMGGVAGNRTPAFALSPVVAARILAVAHAPVHGYVSGPFRRDCAQVLGSPFPLSTSSSVVASASAPIVSLLPPLAAASPSRCPCAFAAAFVMREMMTRPRASTGAPLTPANAHTRVSAYILRLRERTWCLKTCSARSTAWPTIARPQTPRPRLSYRNMYSGRCARAYPCPHPSHLLMILPSIKLLPPFLSLRLV